MLILRRSLRVFSLALLLLYQARSPDPMKWALVASILGLAASFSLSTEYERHDADSPR